MSDQPPSPRGAKRKNMSSEEDWARKRARGPHLPEAMHANDVPQGLTSPITDAPALGSPSSDTNISDHASDTDLRQDGFSQSRSSGQHLSDEDTDTARESVPSDGSRASVTGEDDEDEVGDEGRASRGLHHEARDDTEGSGDADEDETFAGFESESEEDGGFQEEWDGFDDDDENDEDEQMSEIGTVVDGEAAVVPDAGGRDEGGESDQGTPPDGSEFFQEPRRGALLDPPLRDSTVTTYNWKGEHNRNRPYNSLTIEEERRRRHRAIRRIKGLLGGASFFDWIPRHMRPTNLPESPYDWSSEILEELLNLLEATKGDTEKAWRCLARAPTKRKDARGHSGGAGMRIGSQDIGIAVKIAEKYGAQQELLDYQRAQQQEREAALEVSRDRFDQMLIADTAHREIRRLERERRFSAPSERTPAEWVWLEGSLRGL